MKHLVIIPSVRLSANFGKYAENSANHKAQKFTWQKTVDAAEAFFKTLIGE